MKCNRILCDNEAHKKGLCIRHYFQERRKNFKQCEEPTCRVVFYPHAPLQRFCEVHSHSSLRYHTRSYICGDCNRRIFLAPVERKMLAIIQNNLTQKV